MPRSRADRPSTRRPLGSAYWRLWFAAVVSNTGSGLTLTALPLLALAAAGQHTGARALGLVAAVSAAPVLLFAIPSGMAADRFSRKRLLIIADVARAFALAVGCSLIVTGHITVALAASLGFVLGAGEALFNSASLPLIPQLVTDDQLEDADGKLSVANQTAEFVGPPVGSFTYAAARFLPFGLDAISYLGSAWLLHHLDEPVDEPVDPANDPVSPGEGSMRSAIGMLVRTRPLLVLWIALTTLAACGAVTLTLMVLILRDQVGLSEAWVGTFIAMTAVGSATAGLDCGPTVARFGAKPTLVASVGLNAASYMVFGSAATWPVAIVGLYAWGYAVTTGKTIALAQRQRLVPDSMRGRVLSMFLVATATGGVLGSLAAGGLGDVIGAGHTVIVAGAVQFAVCVLLWVALPVPATGAASSDEPVTV